MLHDRMNAKRRDARWTLNNGVGSFEKRGESAKREEGKLFFLAKVGEYGLELFKLLGLDTCKRNSERVALKPSHLGFINSQWPIEPRDMEPTFKCRSLHHLRLAFDPTPSGRNVEGPTLAFLILS
jgi:hypothetical protein